MANSDKKKNIILLSIMAVAIIGTLYLILHKDNKVEISGSIEDSLIQEVNNTTEVSANADSDVFDSPAFKSLEEYSEETLILSPKGKRNPFEPFAPGIQTSDTIGSDR